MRGASFFVTLWGPKNSLEDSSEHTRRKNCRQTLIVLVTFLYWFLIWVNHRQAGDGREGKFVIKAACFVIQGAGGVRRDPSWRKSNSNESLKPRSQTYCRANVIFWFCLFCRNGGISFFSRITSSSFIIHMP